MIYLNEIDPFAVEWLKWLSHLGEIGPAIVDGRSIHDVSADDLIGYRRCHFFSGIAGWELALQLAGYGDLECWTGSCPCQPFSPAGKQEGIADPRHLWPVWFPLIRESRPKYVFGEQVSAAVGHGWLDGVFADLEGAGYACGACVLGAHSVGAPHIRQRLYWGAVRNSWLRDAKNGRASNEKQGEMPRESDQWLLDSHNDGRETGRIATEATRYGSASDATGRGLQHAESNGRDTRRAEPIRGSTASGRGGVSVNTTREEFQCITNGKGRSAGYLDTRQIGLCGAEDAGSRCGSAGGFATNNGMGNTNLEGPQIGIMPGRVCSGSNQPGTWQATVVRSDVDAGSDYTIAEFRDGKKRRVGAGIQPLAYGVPRGMGRGEPELRQLLRRASQNRTGRLKAYGNAIFPQVAAVFIRAFMESIEGAGL